MPFMVNTDEILQRIQDRLDARLNGGGASPASAASNAGGMNASHLGFDVPRAAVPSGAGVVKLTPDQIASKVFIIAPVQIEFIAETFARAVAEAMNMRNFAPKIREIAEKALTDSLCAAKKQGAGFKK
jgi:hypothetical protein